MQNISSGPIGVFDSGIGGLNVLKKLTEVLPNEDFIYLGDNKNAPYGNKSYNELKRLVFSSLDTLLRFGVKAIVVACNTASTLLKDDLLKRYNLPVILTLPPTEYNNAVLICTPNTAKSEYVKNNFKGLVVPLPMLAAEIERNVFEKQKINYKLDLNALPKKVDKLILGCTHYLYLVKEIEKEVGAIIIDSSDEVAKNLKSTLITKKLISINGSGNVKFVGEFSGYNSLVYKKVLQ